MQIVLLKIDNFNDGGNNDASDDVCEASDVSICLAEAENGETACVSAAGVHIFSTRRQL